MSQRSRCSPSSVTPGGRFQRTHGRAVAGGAANVARVRPWRRVSCEPPTGPGIRNAAPSTAASHTHLLVIACVVIGRRSNAISGSIASGGHTSLRRSMPTTPHDCMISSDDDPTRQRRGSAVPSSTRHYRGTWPRTEWGETRGEIETGRRSVPDFIPGLATMSCRTSMSR